MCLRREDDSQKKLWGKCLLITIALLCSAVSVSKWRTQRVSYSVLSGLKIRERSCRHTDTGREFIVLEVDFIPETVLGLREAPGVSRILWSGLGLQCPVYPLRLSVFFRSDGWSKLHSSVFHIQVAWGTPFSFPHRCSLWWHEAYWLWMTCWIFSTRHYDWYLIDPKKKISEMVMNCSHSLWKIKFSETWYSSNGCLLGKVWIKRPVCLVYHLSILICDACSWILSARTSAQHHTQVLTLMSLGFEQVILHSLYMTV